ncbi:MAG: helix-turn-helix domain-containing protein [Prevotellaceae bacterium]|jgi:transcriptional regulator with XRE-family HTH domain|nr:helix-turn-helix domain-containing protein [Prevotellaceae bacterium]
MDLQKIGTKIRVTRVGKGLNQENIATELGISITAYSKIERGKTNISILRLDQIAKCLDVSVVDFLIEQEVRKGEGMESITSNLEVENLLLRKEVTHLNKVIETKDEMICLLKKSMD